MSLAAMFLAACTPGQKSPEKVLLELVPTLSLVAARHLVDADDSTLTHYLREIGLASIENVRYSLYAGILYDSEESYAWSSSVLLPYVKRIEEFVVSETHNDYFLDRYRFHSSLSPRRALMWNELNRKDLSTYNDPDLTPDEKITRLAATMEACRKQGFDGLAVQCKVHIAEMYANLGDRTAYTLHFREALVEAYETGKYSLACQTLGVLGSIYEDAGQTDSMIVCWEEVKKLADRYPLPGRAARVNSFYANFYKRKGELSLAHDLYEEVLEDCVKNKLGYYGLRFWIEAMKFHADLGSWESIGRMLPTVRAIESRSQDVPPDLKRSYPHGVSQIEARYLMAVGRVEKAVKIFESIKEPIGDLAAELLYPQLLFYWAEGLVHNGRGIEALPLIREGYQRSEQMKRAILPAQFLLIRARAQFQSGDINAAKKSLDGFERKAVSVQNELRTEWIDRDVLKVKICRAEGDDRAAAAALEEGISRLRYFAGNTDACVQGYLWIGKCGELRRLLHELVAAEPALGYGAEFFWRDTYRKLHNPGGTIRPAADSLEMPPAGDTEEPQGLRSQLRIYAEAARARILDRNAIHCVYLTVGDNVWRWTCSPAGIRRDVLDTPADRLRNLVTVSWGKISSDPGDRTAGIQLELARDLRTLALALLPGEILGDSGGGRRPAVYVAAGGFLGQIPFETLNVGSENDYVPLLSRRDVVYLRHADAEIPGSEKTGGVVMANIGGTGRLSRGYVFGRDLEEVKAEGAAVARARPGSLFLHGESATKANLLEAWEEAPLVYFATHVIRDPEVPYLAMIPLANPNHLGPAASYLDTRDIREAALDKCQVVVLSGCASGAPYVGARNEAPGLGDVFLDSGAGMVIQTFWDVRDNEARELMTDFVRRWGSVITTDGLIISLGDVRRSFLTGPNGVRHPFYWAAYSIKISRL